MSPVVALPSVGKADPIRALLVDDDQAYREILSAELSAKGVVVRAFGDGASLLVDTLFDLTLTAEMLEAMRSLLDDSPLSAAFNTHGNGDHCYGNQLLPAALRIYATEIAAQEIRAVPPAAALPAATPAAAAAPFTTEDLPAKNSERQLGQVCRLPMSPSWSQYLC